MKKTLEKKHNEIAMNLIDTFGKDLMVKYHELLVGVLKDLRSNPRDDWDDEFKSIIKESDMVTRIAFEVLMSTTSQLIMNFAGSYENKDGKDGETCLLDLHRSFVEHTIKLTAEMARFLPKREKVDESTH